jgi:hypothetical protein
MKVDAMRTRTLWIVLALAPLAACNRPSAASASSSGAVDDDFAREVDALPTQDEADLQAAKDINANNADAEFQKLMQELESSPDDGG